LKNNRIIWAFIVYFFAATLTTGLASSQNENTKSELSQLKGKIKSLQKSLSKTQKKQSIALKQLRSTEKKIATASKILRSTLHQLQQKQRELTRLHKKLTRLEQDKAIQKEALADQLRSAYMNGKQEYLKLLLNQQDPDELGRMLVYYDYMNKARSQQVKALQSTLSELNSVDKKIKLEIDGLSILKRSKESETRSLIKLQSKRQSLVKKLSNEITLKSDELTELEINAQELQQLIDSVRDTIDAMDFSQPLEGLKKIKGRLHWPAKGKQIVSYGSVDRGQKSSGVLIASKQGSEISAIHHGRVVYSDWLRGFGLLLILDHGKGYMSLYGHNESLYKDVGDWVEAQEAVATLGQSGGRNSPALYFELRYQGKPINPKKWFKGTPK